MKKNLDKITNRLSNRFAINFHTPIIYMLIENGYLKDGNLKINPDNTPMWDVNTITGICKAIESRDGEFVDLQNTLLDRLEMTISNQLKDEKELR